LQISKSAESKANLNDPLIRVGVILHKLKIQMDGTACIRVLEAESAPRTFRPYDHSPARCGSGGRGACDDTDTKSLKLSKTFDIMIKPDQPPAIILFLKIFVCQQKIYDTGPFVS
jgi:hypothetical protein